MVWPTLNFENSLINEPSSRFIYINGPPFTPSGPQQNTAKWKKLARAHYTTNASPDHTQPLKRVLLSSEANFTPSKRQRGIQNSFDSEESLVDKRSLEEPHVEISAEVGFQPCRKP
jgi:hypothetical protein